MFQGQTDSSVVEDSSLLGCDTVLLAGWFDHVFKLLTPPQNISTPLHAPSHISTVHFIDKSTTVFSHHHKALTVCLHPLHIITTHIYTVSNNKMADMQQCDTGSILVAINLGSKCGAVLYLQKVCYFCGGRSHANFSSWFDCS
jgi:hypothetical protein